MRPSRKLSRNSIAVLLLALAPAGQAHERTGPSGGAEGAAPKALPCAVIERFAGDLQILDATRTHLEDPRLGGGIECGSWVSVSKGWVVLKHQGGALIRLGEGSFIRLKDEADALILHHGQAFLAAGHGRGPIRLITPNARIEVKKGTVLAIYSPDEEESQLIALEDSAEIMNRFETSRPVTVRAGEGSSLNFKLLRVVPSAPRAVAVAALRKHLSDLKLEGRTRDAAVAAIQRRQERKFASHTATKAERAPASEQTYARHPAGVDDEFIRRTMARKVAGDERAGDAVLHPSRTPAGTKPIKGKAEVTAVDDPLESKAATEESAEKKRLIEELSRIKPEEE
jgi:hypothetical protein